MTRPEQPVLHITPTAAAQLEHFARRNGTHVRLEVNPGGCSGFDLRFAKGAPREDDGRFGPAEAELLIDPVSLELLAGATVDYADAIGKEGFIVVNIPNLEARCGCGTSFSLKDE